MKRYKFFKYVSIIVLMLLSACSDDSLDVDPTGKWEDENYPSTNEEGFAVIIGAYDLMQWNYGRDWTSCFFAKNLPADDCNAGSSSSDQLPYQNLDDFKNEADNTVTTGIWEGFYKTINQCNILQGRLNPDNDYKKQLVAEAKAIRAWNYIELVTMFGDVPYYTEISTMHNANRKRTAVSEIYTAIESDLKEAIEVLPYKSNLPDDQKFRISKGAAQSILGKIYLYQQRWQEAHQLFSEVIATEGSEYSLEPDFKNVWREAGELGVESVFEILYTSQEGYDWNNFPWNPNLHESNVHIVLMGPREDLFKQVDAIGLLPGWGFNLPNESIGKAFEDMGDQGPRYENTIISEDEFVAAGGKMVGDSDEDFHDYDGYLRLKYSTYESESSPTASVKDLNYTTNWRLIRYADVLLMAAEAYNEDGDEASARRELNKVRVRAKLDTYDNAMPQDELRDAIKAERQLELAFEGSRYWDLIRWGDAEKVLGPLGFVAGKHEHFPIPQSEISANNEISQEDQNPGF
jgi:starch-binding outer membrane protein, SusD/RagB family